MSQSDLESSDDSSYSEDSEQSNGMYERVHKMSLLSCSSKIVVTIELVGAYQKKRIFW